MPVVGLAAVGLVYVVAGGIALAVHHAVPGAPILAVLLADLVATGVVFAASRISDNSSMYDPYWSVVPPLIALAWWGDGDLGRQIVVGAAVSVWAIRLTWNWASHWGGLAHEDWRYVELRGRHRGMYWWVSLGGIHYFPTVLVFLGCLPLYPILTSSRAYSLADAGAMAVLVGAIALEAVADRQLRDFSRREHPHKSYCDEGLWAWCRHPNYLGEMGFWWGLWLLGVAADPGWWWSAIGAVSITVMFLVVSAPWLDQRNLARRQGYADHVLRTWSLLPWPPGRG